MNGQGGESERSIGNSGRKSKRILKRMEDIFEIAQNSMQEVNGRQIKALEERIDCVLPVIENGGTIPPIYNSRPFQVLCKR